MSDGRAERIFIAYGGQGVTRSLATAVVAMADRLGTGAFDLANLINFESGWNPKAINKSSGASGLIQFMPSTAKGLGTTVEVIRTYNRAAQLALAERYFKKLKPPFPTVQSLYMAVFYPVARSWSLTKEMPANVQKANPGIKTVSDYIALANKRAKLPVGGKARVAVAPAMAVSTPAPAPAPAPTPASPVPAASQGNPLDAPIVPRAT